MGIIEGKKRKKGEKIDGGKGMVRKKEKEESGYERMGNGGQREKRMKREKGDREEGKGKRAKGKREEAKEKGYSYIIAKDLTGWATSPAFFLCLRGDFINGEGVHDVKGIGKPKETTKNIGNI